MSEDKISKEIRTLGVQYESMQDDMQKLIEIIKAQQPALSKIPKMSERIEEIEHDIGTVKLATMATSSDLKLIKIRTEKLDEIIDELKDHEVRLKQLEVM